MKKAIQFFLQRLLGFERYLFVFALFVRARLPWDKKEGHFLHFLSLLEEDFVVLDIGANVGVMTTLLAKTCHKGHVFAFEPVPENLTTMHKMIRHFKLSNITVLPIALGEKKDVVQISMPVMQGVRMQGLSHISSHQPDLYEAEVHSYEVEQNSLDGLMELENTSVSAIKMDVENYEYFVMKGGKEMLAKDNPIIYCELWDNENRVKVMTLLEELGYSCQVFDGKNLQPFTPGQHKQQNFFFLPS